MPTQQLHIESIDRLTDNTFVLNFSDDTVAILTDYELLEHYAGKRILAHGYNNHMLTTS